MFFCPGKPKTLIPNRKPLNSIHPEPETLNPMPDRKGSDFIREKIFPGSHLPCLAEIHRSCSQLPDWSQTLQGSVSNKGWVCRLCNCMVCTMIIYIYIYIYTHTHTYRDRCTELDLRSALLRFVDILGIQMWESRV